MKITNKKQIKKTGFQMLRSAMKTGARIAGKVAFGGSFKRPKKIGMSATRKAFDQQFTTIRGANAIAKHKATVTPDQVSQTKSAMKSFIQGRKKKFKSNLKNL